MKKLLVAVLLFLASCVSFAQDADPALEAFKAKTEREFAAHDESTATCRTTIVDRQPNGPGRVIVLQCDNMEYVCAYVVTPNPQNEDGFDATAIQCAENPSYVKRLGV